MNIKYRHYSPDVFYKERIGIYLVRNVGSIGFMMMEEIREFLFFSDENNKVEKGNWIMQERRKLDNSCSSVIELMKEDGPNTQLEV